MSSTATFDQVIAHLKTLRLATLRKCLEAYLQEAQAQSLTHLARISHEPSFTF